ncbi:hypothetical protein [Stratiformator vulcanicus]|uniref:Uncharacterized protein n=1 Tax=Stratiformator vulcanicus TaxID=2527980 RepID=A0A517QWL7_9PLAN|nr:hypothetical protein [Stratiformator vulcanicus]QDT35973.1 hypothetical protein Pan189_03280 [Stratiformator vulcanicus]
MTTPARPWSTDRSELPLAELAVGISISEADEEELKLLGLGEAFQRQNFPIPAKTGESDFIDAFNQEHPDEAIDCPALVFAFQRSGVAGQNNRLTAAENHVLFESDRMEVIVALVLKGLTQVAAG